MSDGFQTQVYYQPAPGVEGAFCNENPRATVDAGQFGLVAGPAGVRIGYFGWLNSDQIDGDNAPSRVNSFGSGPVSGFVAREEQGLNTTYLSDASMMIPQGFPMTLYSASANWVKNNGTTQALPGMKAYANLATGAASFAATGSPSSASFTGAIAAETFSVTGSITGSVLTVTAVGSGTIVAGAAISGTNVASGTTIVDQLSGTTGGIGTYAVTPAEQTVASTTISGTYGQLTVSAVSSGTIVVGGSVAGSEVTAGTVITALGTGTGGTGTYIVNLTQTVSSESLTATTNVETKWYAMSSGLAGELVKISSWPLG